MKEAEFISHGLRCVAVWAERCGHRCGYVVLGRDHPLWGVRYNTPVPQLRPLTKHAPVGKKSPILVHTAGLDALEGDTVRCSPDCAFDVHGGITYSDLAVGLDYGVGTEDEWAFGFDCGHDLDIHDPKSLEYVRSECKRLALQLQASRVLFEDKPMAEEKK